MAMSMGAKNMFLATCLFCLMELCVKMLDRIPTYQVVFFRALIAMLICIAWLASQRISPFGKKRYDLLILRGIFGTFSLFGYFYTLQHMPLATAVTIQKMSPIFTVLFAGLLIGEGATRWQWLTIGLCFGGVLLIKGFDPRVEWIMVAMGVGAAMCAAFAYNMIRLIGPSEHPLVIILYFPLITFLLVGPYTAMHWIPPTPKEWLILLAVGITTQIAQIFMTKAFQGEKAADFVHFYYLGIVFAAGLGWLIFGESLNFLSGAGILVIVFALVLSHYIPRFTKAPDPLEKLGEQSKVLD